MSLAAKSPPPRLARAIVRRTRGRTHGPVTRLMSPSDFGEILKPFVFLDLFDHEGPPFNGPLPSSFGYRHPDLRGGRRRQLHRPGQREGHAAGRRRRMDAGGTRHVGTAAGSIKQAGRRGFQLWIALPPELESGPTISIYQSPEDVPQNGPVRVLLGSSGSASIPSRPRRRSTTLRYA